MKNIVVAGAGTAGWLTALYAKKIFPKDNISIIYSEDIDILGAGEGSTPHLVEFLDYLDIPVSNLISEVGATIKLGIKFTNWSKNNKDYFHTFSPSFGLTSENKIIDRVSDFEIKPHSSIIDFLGYSDNSLIDFLTECSKNKVLPFSFNNNQYTENPIEKFDQFGQWALHFDARLLAKKLEKIGINRGINVITGTISNVNQSVTGNIESIILDNDVIVKTDFIFDCTGFSRFFIKKYFNTEWESFSEYLPMKKAVPFFIDIDKENIPAYTESIAMNYGWMWKIPLQDRYGCGYVYDSNFISDEEAKVEIKNFLGFEPKYPRENPFVFNPGCYKEVWNNNCLAVGLSSAFIEPLEATSILQTIVLLKSFFSNKHHIFNNNELYIKLFNKKYLEETRNIVDFISLHYLTNKDNNEFWNNFVKNNKVSDNLKKRIILLNNSLMYDTTTNNLFTSKSYYRVLYGLECLNIKNIKNIIEENNIKRFNFAKIENDYLVQNILETLIDHNTFLKTLGGLKN